MLRVGFVGLGRMGRGMARCILRGGHDLIVYNRTANNAADLASEGASVAPSIAAACADRDVVITMLADDAALEEVALGAGGVRDSLTTDAIHLVMGTHGVAAMHAIDAAHRRARQTLVAAPVLGRPDKAAAGELGIIAAGPKAAVDRCRPLFAVMGGRTFDAGASPVAAAATKLANNFAIGCALEAMSEAFSFVRKFDVPPQILYEVMTEGLLAAPVYRVYGKIIVDDRYDQAGFTVQLALKDAELMAAAADSVHVPLPSGALLRDRLRDAITQGNGEKDWAILGRVQARLSGLDEED